MSKNNPYSKEIVNKWMRKGVVCPKINHIFFGKLTQNFVGEMRKWFGEVTHIVGEMTHIVGEMKQTVGEMKRICWGNEAKLLGK